MKMLSARKKYAVVSGKKRPIFLLFQQSFIIFTFIILLYQCNTAIFIFFPPTVGVGALQGLAW